jgi:non-specific serine/threonine protein kinase
LKISSGFALCIEALAWIAASRRHAARAMTLLGAAAAAWASIPATLPAPLGRHHDTALATARAALTDAAQRAAFEKGNSVRPADAVAIALGEPPGPDPRPGTGRAAELPGPLTRRERDVAALVARGLSNRQIAGELVISARTAETHVQHIMDKRGFNTRTQIAAWSAGSQEGGTRPSRPRLRAA